MVQKNIKKYLCPKRPKVESPFEQKGDSLVSQNYVLAISMQSCKRANEDPDGLKGRTQGQPGWTAETSGGCDSNKCVASFSTRVNGRMWRQSVWAKRNLKVYEAVR